MRPVFCVVFILLLSNCGISKAIIDKPIIFDEERVALTKEYIKNRYGLEKDSIIIDPKMIVLHWTATPTFEGSFDAFYKSTLPSWRPDLENVSGLNVSTHFLVDKDGKIYRMMPENYMGRHVIGLNYYAIGIENVGGTSESPLTKKQLKSNIKLVKYLAKKYDIKFLIGHYEYINFEDHPLWLEQDEGYRTQKTDPGEDFMIEVRKATKRYNFTPVPLKN
ncbi:peptidoglycan recognition family protein [Croceitalea sp. MTPC9]|uniref:peptidoglycan recognition protein family protein n=1 Tax=unclassified Croceitalea TaxID=2632280 RepID=UPI002B3EF5E0|nr:peptidoglycan recognition family protein [Croceitalea sp. MTPC6]GMN15738.1 peptidoglycan recognition family protein [Croceitalea sp. MTPC9]